MPSGQLSLEVDGLLETIRAFDRLSADLRRSSSAEMRNAAGECARVLVGNLRVAAASSGVPVAPRVARSIRVQRDRLPVVSIGGSTRVGAGGAPASVLVWGREQGPKGEVHHFAVEPSSGYWIAPTVSSFTRSDALVIYRRAVYELQRKVGLV